MPLLIVVRGQVADDEYKYPTIPPLPRRRRGGPSLVCNLSEVSHQDLICDGSRHHRSGPAARPAPSLPPPNDDRPGPCCTPRPSPSPLSFTMFSHDGRRRRGGALSGNRSLVPTKARGGAGGGVDATRGHIDDYIVLVRLDVHRIVVVVVVQRPSPMVVSPVPCLWLSQHMIFITICSVEI